MKFVDNWKECKKWASLHAMWIAGALQGAWLYIPDSMKAQFPAWGLNVLTVVLLLIGFIGRFIDQSSKAPTQNDDPPKLP